MATIIKFKKRPAAEKFKGRVLCSSGFHKWEIVKGNDFAVSQGGLVTAYICKRCGQKKNTTL